MAFSMHTHSGQFCPGHAADQLENILKRAISLGYKTIAFTEHMPRYDVKDLYPEEMDNPEASLAALPPRHQAYIVESQRLQAVYASQIHILIGFEAEFIDASYAAHVQALALPAGVDFFIGSLHHVHSIPIDYNAEIYAAALTASGGSEERLFEDYYDLQLQMLRALKPRVVGHFDLVRLMSSLPGRDLKTWPGVWEKVVRNLGCVREQGGWLECNTSALRKGLAEPYPCRQIAEEWLKMGGKFTVSDDSHGIAQVATNYVSAMAYLKSVGVKEVWTFRRDPHPGVKDEIQSKLVPISITVDEFAASLKIE